MMEECGYKKHDDYNDSETDASLDTTIRGKVACTDITSMAMMEECGYIKKN